MLNIINNDIQKINIDISKMKNKTILITGTSGLIGIYLLSYLKSVQKEYNITIYTWCKSKIDDIFKSLFDGCNNIIGDITNLDMYKDLPDFDYIIHAAGYGQPMKFLSEKIKTIELNTISTIKLFEKIKKNGSFLFVSSSEVYNGLESYHISEDQIGTTNTNNNRSCYIEGKRCGEAICHSYMEQGYDVKIARLSLAYGPGTRMSDTRVMNAIIEKAIKNNSIDLLDGGQAIRTYCYVSDVVEMFLNVLLFGKHKIYNIGGIETHSILDLANLVGEIFKKPVTIPETQQGLMGNPKIVNISIERYVNEFNKKSFVKFRDGLHNTIEWQKKLYMKP